MKLLAGKSALVSGGGRRIGRAIARSLAAEGANVAVTYHSNATAAHSTVAELKAMGVHSIAVSCDLRAEISVRRAFLDALERFGRLDLLVNNAAVYESATLDAITVEQWDNVFETNTRGPFLMARAALPALNAAQGRIIHLGSIGGLRAWPSHAHYCASKAALHMLTQSMARAFAPRVSVNCVAPGWIEMEEPGQAEEASAAAAAHFAAKTPMKRNGAAQEVADAVLFFATGPKFITGQILAVDGGLSLV